MTGMPPVSTDSRYITVGSEFNDPSQSMYSIKIIADNNVNYGIRDAKLNSNDPEYIVNDILEDFKAKYSGMKEYKTLNYHTIAPELILDGDSVYNIAKLTYDNSEDNKIHDLYLLKYDLEAKLLDIKLLEEGTGVVSMFDAFQPYKYGDNIIFKLARSSYNYIYSYNLTENKYNFKYQIGTEELANISKRDTALVSYIVTGDTIIFPEFVKSAEQSNNNETHYSIVFRVMDIANGDILKTLTHKSLSNLIYGYDYKGVSITSSLSDENSAYFFAQTGTRTTLHKLLIKIDLSNNRVQKSKYRMDNQHSGVIKDYNQ